MTDFRAARPWSSRRDFLKSSAAVAAGVYGMGWGLADAADPPLEFDGSKFLLKAAEPNPKRGGVIRIGIPVRPPHFDLHQSGTIFQSRCDGMHVRQFDPARPARRRQDHHPRSGA
jgi:TAT (twin-arginine translocation) pathway signal sequence